MNGPGLKPVRDADCIIVGGGNAGIALAAYLRREAPGLSLVVVAPESQHRYRPLLSYVGAGMCSPGRTVRSQGSLIPAGVEWVQDEVVQLIPAPTAGEGGLHTVVTGGGSRLRAADVVLCPGTEVDWNAVPGSRQACESPFASTNYLPELAPRTWEVLRSLQDGDAVFVVSRRNTPCPAVGLKPLFLAADHWRRHARLGAIAMTLLIEDPDVFGLEKVDRLIGDKLTELNVRVRAGVTLERMDPDSREVHYRDAQGTQAVQHYDALHLAPAHRGHQWLIDAGVTDADTTLVATDPLQLSVVGHPGLWALGDAASVETPPSGGSLRHQVPVVGDNIIARRTDGRPRFYDGYTVAPIPLDRSKLLLGERDRLGNEVRTLPFLSLARASRLLLLFDLFVQPPVYWYRLLRGRGVARQ